MLECRNETIEEDINLTPSIDEIADWTPSIEELTTWEPSEHEFIFGRTLMMSEDYSIAVMHHGKNIAFNALAYCILSSRERFSRHITQFNEYLSETFAMGEYIDSSLSVLKNEEVVRENLKKYGFGNRKGDALISAAKAWNELNLTERLRDDVNKEHGFEIRDDMVNAMHGVGYKFTSLALRMYGYHEIVTIDSWATKFLESKGLRGRKVRSGFTRDGYLKYEKAITEFADAAFVSPALYQAAVYATCSTWLKDSEAFKY